VGCALGDEGEADDDDVEPVPAVADEAPAPVAEGVEAELDGEGGGEEEVDARVDPARRREVAHFVHEEFVKLGVEDAGGEVLRPGRADGQLHMGWFARDVARG
jgi:hypothetical protein